MPFTILNLEKLKEFFNKKASSSVFILENRINETLITKDTSYGRAGFNQDRSQGEKRD